MNTDKYHVDPDGRICKHDPHKHLSSVKICGLLIEREKELGILQRAVDRRNEAIDGYWKPYVERAKAELARTEAVLVDCQKAHDFTIAERDEATATLATIRTLVAEEEWDSDFREVLATALGD